MQKLSPLKGGGGGGGEGGGGAVRVWCVGVAVLVVMGAGVGAMLLVVMSVCARGRVALVVVLVLVILSCLWRELMLPNPIAQPYEYPAVHSRNLDKSLYGIKFQPYVGLLEGFHNFLNIVDSAGPVIFCSKLGWAVSPNSFRSFICHGQFRSCCKK